MQVAPWCNLHLFFSYLMCAHVRLSAARAGDVALFFLNIADTRFPRPARHKLRLCFVRLSAACAGDVALNV